MGAVYCLARCTRRAATFHRTRALCKARGVPRAPSFFWLSSSIFFAGSGMPFFSMAHFGRAQGPPDSYICAIETLLQDLLGVALLPGRLRDPHQDTVLPVLLQPIGTGLGGAGSMRHDVSRALSLYSVQLIGEK